MSAPLVIEFDVPEADGAPVLSYNPNLYRPIDHRPDYIIHCVSKSGDMHRLSSHSHVKKVFIEINCAENADKFLFSAGCILRVNRTTLSQNLIDYSSGLRCERNWIIIDRRSQFY